MPKPTLISSPLQSFTDYNFRNAVDRFYGGIDEYYAPYIKLFGKLEIKDVYKRDLQPKNNKHTKVIPQIMTNSGEEFVFVAKYVQSLGYQEVNWNLGCPYPMVATKCLGSGLIAEPDRIDHILDQVHTETDIVVSMKMRMGYLDAKEILSVFPVLEKYPIRNIGIHARIGKQLYKGGVDLDGFQRCVDYSPHKLYYNGDITTVAIYRTLSQRFPTIDTWMLGRGLIADPCLPMMIKNNSDVYSEDRLDRFRKFHDVLFSSFEQRLSGEKHVIMKMSSFWEYFSWSFPEFTRDIKKIRKVKNFQDYDTALANFYAAYESP